MLQALAASATAGHPALDGAGAELDEQGALRLHAPPGPSSAPPQPRGSIVAREAHEHGFEALVPLDEGARALLELYAPLCVGARSADMVVAHLGQSLDGRVATVTGASRFVTGPEDVRHMHRLRALFDAVLVGARTACIDNPRLTTRLVPGRQPARVVLDPNGRLDSSLGLLRDGLAPTFVVRARAITAPRAGWGSHVELIEVERGGDGRLPPRALLDALAARGLRRVFIEGGGITVSRFLEAHVLDRLQVAVAPKIIGSGTPALQLKPIERMADAITTHCRCIRLGADVLFDCKLTPADRAQ